MRLDVTPELTFLDAERVDGSVAGVDDSVVGAGGHDGVVDREAGVFGNVQLPAELAHKRQAHGPDLEEREGGVTAARRSGTGWRTGCWEGWSRQSWEV